MNTKKQYNQPAMLVVPYNVECMLQTLSKDQTESKGDTISGPESGGGTSTETPAKEHNTNSAWGAWDDEDDWK